MNLATANHLIWAAGLLGHAALALLLLTRWHGRRFTFFTLLMIFYFVRAIALALIPGRLAHAAMLTAIAGFDISGLFLEFGVLAELVFLALRPLGRLHRASVSTLLLASGAVVVIRLAPISRYSGRAVAPLLLHFLIAILFLEWSIVLAFLLRSLHLRWRSDVAAVSFGFGVYSAALLFAGGYFRIARDMNDYVYFSYLRAGIYLAVLLWWVVNLAPRNCSTANNLSS